MQPDIIHTGDARRLAKTIPDGSVDLIFCDPVYQNICDYTWLAKTALRVLRPDAPVLAWTSVRNAGPCQNAMERAGLEYVYTLFYTVTAKVWRLNYYKIFCWTTPCLWFQRPGETARPNQWMPDTFHERVVLDNAVISSANPTGSFVWNKNLSVLVRWLERFSQPGDLIYDPFTGTGSIPIACRMTGRHFLASELVPERADDARARLDATPYPLVGIVPERRTQEAMDVA